MCGRLGIAHYQLLSEHPFLSTLSAFLLTLSQGEPGLIGERAFPPSDVRGFPVSITFS